MNKSQPFRRSIHIFNMIAAFAGMSGTLPPIPQYYSRGHSGKQAQKTGHKHMAYVRKMRKKYGTKKQSAGN